MKRFSILVLVLITVTCTQRNKNEFKGVELEVNYKRVQSLDHDMWIKIDDVVFKHDKFLSNDTLASFLLPTSIVQVVYDSVRNKPMNARTPSFAIPLILSDYLNKINLKDSLYTDKSDYMLTDPQGALVGGILKFKRIDNEPITISTSEGYPAIVKVVKK